MSRPLSLGFPWADSVGGWTWPGRGALGPGLAFLVVVLVVGGSVGCEVWRASALEPVRALLKACE